MHPAFAFALALLLAAVCADPMIELLDGDILITPQRTDGGDSDVLFALGSEDVRSVRGIYEREFVLCVCVWM